MKRTSAWILALALILSILPVGVLPVMAVETEVTNVSTLAQLLEALADNTNSNPIVITDVIVIPEGETVELNLNGKTVNAVFNGTSTTNHIYALKNYGTLTITDTSAMKNGSINSRGIYNYGNLTLEAGAINTIDGNGGYAVKNETDSTFVMNGGLIAATYEDDYQSSSGGYDATPLNVPAGCTATLNGGKITNVCDFTFAVAAGGTLNIPANSTIEIIGTHGAIAVSGGKTTINAGKFSIPSDNYSRTDNVLYVSGGAMEINGGTFIGDSDVPSGGSCVCDVVGAVTINGGNFSGSSGGDVWGTTGTTIKGGTFANLTETAHIAVGYQLNENGQVVSTAPVLPEYVVLPEGVTVESFGENTVTDGVNYYPTLVAALTGIHLTDNRVLYCKPGADVGVMTHGHVCDNLTVYGNDAYVSGGEQDFEIGMYKYCHNGANVCDGITEDLTLIVEYLHGSGAWGNRGTDDTVNLVFKNCQDMGRIYINGVGGVNNISLTDCSFTSNVAGDCKVYSNANGTVKLTRVDFANVNVAVNLNHKVAGKQIVEIIDCTFVNCGYGDYDYAAPVRVLSSVDGAESELTISGCTFTGTIANKQGQTADILLDYGVGTTNATVTDTAANVTVETESNVGTSTVVTAEEEKSFTNVVKNYVAYIGEQGYETLEAALEAAVAGQTITLAADITLNSRLVVASDLTIDLNGKELKLTQVNNRVWKNATLTFVGGGAIECSAVNGGNVFYIGGAETGAGTAGHMVLNGIKVYGDGYNTGTNAAVFMMYGPAGNTTLDITDCEIALSNNKGNGSVFYDTGTNCSCKVNIVNSDLIFDGTVRGSVCGDITIDNSNVVIKNSDNGFNEAKLTIKNNSVVSIFDNVGRGITINRNGLGVVIQDSVVMLENNAEGDIRFKASAELTISNSTVTTKNGGACNVVVDEGKSATINGEAVVDASTVKSVDGVVTVTAPAPEGGYVAYIGEQGYETLRDAIKAVKEGETIILAAGIFSEGTVQFPATLKNVTIKGAKDKASILQDMTIASADGNSISYVGITIDGVVFDNASILMTGWRTNSAVYQNWTITNCEFKNINNTTNSAAVHFNLAEHEAMVNFTFTNNIIDGALGGSKSGIYLQATGEVLVKDNVINNVAFRPYVIQLTVNDGVADNFVVTGNTFSGTASGRAQGLGNSATGTDSVNLVVSGNIFKDIINAQQICYWNFNAETTTADLSKNYYDIDILANPGKIYYNGSCATASDLVNANVFPYYTELKDDGTIDEDSLVEAPDYFEIVTQPQDVEATVNEDVEFSVVVNETEGVTYQWYYSDDGENWAKTGMTGATTATLTVNALAYRNGYQYKCVITYGAGKTVETNVAVMSVKSDMLEVITQPVDAEADIGAEATFSVAVNKTEGVSYQWYYSNDGENWAKTGMTGATTVTLTVKALEYRNGYQYKCVITDNAGKTVETNAVTMTVKNEMLEVTTQPVDAETDIGIEATFSVAVNKTEGVSYQWYYSNNGTNWAKTGMTGATTDTLTVVALAYRNGYQYKCVITYGAGKTVETNVAVMSVKSDMLEVITQPVDAEADIGAEATFSVAVNKTEGVSYQWYYSNDGENWAKTGMTGATTATLTVKALAYRDGYKYKCMITDAAGNTVETNVVTMTVKNEMLEITNQPVDATAEAGKEATFSVAVNKTEGVSYQWYYSNNGTNWAKTGMTGATTDTLTVVALAYRNGYQYKCVITDAAGNIVTTQAAILNLA